MGYIDKEKQREYQREWIANRKANFFSDKICAWCTSKEDLQLHHVDATQKENHRIWSWSKERRDNEISKCIILCDECHRFFHDELRRTPYHGKYQGYHKYGCRCELCKEAAREYWRDYYNRKKKKNIDP